MKDKVPPGTKITRAIAGLLSLAAILYAANPTPFATVNTPVGVAASTTDLIVTEYCGHYAYGGSDAQGLSSEATASQMK
jgi:hypothetical protein